MWERVAHCKKQRAILLSGKIAILLTRCRASQIAFAHPTPRRFEPIRLLPLPCARRTREARLSYRPKSSMPDTRLIHSLGVKSPRHMFFFTYEEGPPEEGQFRVETLYTGFSAGTELTFFKGT